MKEFEYKIWYIEKMNKMIDLRIKELTAYENIFLQRYYQPKVESIQNIRNIILGASGFAVASLIGLLSVDQPSYIKENANTIMILIIIGITFGSGSFAFLTFLKYMYAKRIEVILDSYRKSKIQCVFLQGVLEASTEYLQNLSLFDLFLLQKIIYLLSFNGDFLRVGFLKLSFSKLFYFNQNKLFEESLTQQYFTLHVFEKYYKKYQSEINRILIPNFYSELEPLIAFYEGKIKIYHKKVKHHE